jgi:hypothetical protein
MDAELISRPAVYLFAAPILVGLVELCKQAFGLPPRFAPVLAVVLGLAAAFGTVAALPVPPEHPVLTTMIGLAMGLTAAGLYSGTRALMRAPEPPVRYGPCGTCVYCMRGAPCPNPIRPLSPMPPTATTGGGTTLRPPEPPGRG